jgi:riboflavin biosynthesis pyrimidine reductase
VIVLTIPTGAATMKESASRRPWIRLVTMEQPDQLIEAFRTLRGLGIGLVSCVGGRRLAGELLDCGLIDDAYLTTSPKPGGVPGTPLDPRVFDGSLVVRKRGTGEESAVVFEHFHLRNSAR